MRRTAARPLPGGRLGVAEGTWFGIAAVGGGLAASWRFASTLLAAAVAGATLDQLRAGLHAAQDADVAGDAGRRDPGRAAAGDRLGGGDRQHLAAGAGALRHRVLLADAALPGDRLDVPRRLRARGHPAAAGARARRPAHRPAGAALCRGAVAGQPAAGGRSVSPALPYSVVATVLGLVFIVAGGALRARAVDGHGAARCSSSRSPTCRCSGARSSPTASGSERRGERRWRSPICPRSTPRLNALAAVFLVAGYVLIRRGRRDAHKRCMLGGADHVGALSRQLRHLSRQRRVAPVSRHRRRSASSTSRS